MDDQLHAASQTDSDTQRLHQLGYAQELHRGLSRFSNFAISFTIISILSGCLTLYSYGLNHGGPSVMIWGWAVVRVLVLRVAPSMAEIVFAFPRWTLGHERLLGSGRSIGPVRGRFHGRDSLRVSHGRSSLLLVTRVGAGTD